VKAGEIEFKPLSEEVNLNYLIGKLIHHRQLIIFKDDTSVRSLLGHYNGDIVGHYMALHESRDIHAACYVESDKDEPALFTLSDVVRASAQFLM